MGDEQRPNIKETAKEVSAKWREDSRFFREQVFQNQRWLLASQLTISSGGVISLMNMEAIDSSSRFFAMLWFFGSILSLMLFSHLQGHALAQTFAMQSETASALKRFERKGDKEQLMLASGLARDSKASVFEKLSTPFYYFPFACIVIASTILVEGLK